MVTHAVRCPTCRAAVATDILAAVSGACPSCHRPLTADARHQHAVAQTLGRADDAAERGDHAVALGWLKVLDAIGEQLSSDYERKRESWRGALRTAQTRTGNGG